MHPSAAVSRGITLAVVVIAALVALLSARPFAGSWNDGSRLATVECLVDYGTWVIDQSIFVQPPPASTAAPLPYPAGDTLLLSRGTQDKLFIDGHYYSDKSPVPALYLAAIYRVLQGTTGLVARTEPARFCYLLTLFSSGLAYVISVFCIDRLAQSLGTMTRLLVTASFAFATIALPYARQVNNHILILAVCCVLLSFLNPKTRGQLIAAGLLLGAAYTIDLGIGPVLVLSFIGLVAYRTRSVGKVTLVLLAAFPLFFLHHYFNWRIGGTFGPANAQPAFFLWPGAPFDASNLTGGWAHKSIGHFVAYALDLLFGKRGLLGHNLALFLTLPGVVVLLRSRVKETPEIIWAVSFFVGGWLVYAITSNNYSGLSCSIRWFVPLLAPGYYLLVVLLRYVSRYRAELVILTLFGLVEGALMWWKGPWMPHMVPGFWFIQGGALLAWLLYRFSPRKS
ncbi:MAG: hypothetical protein ABI946_11700 [Chthoniobacterales bacterium]